MAINRAKSKIKSATFSAVITRADGTVENLGVISRYNSNPFKRLLILIQDKMKTLKEK